MHCSLGEKFPAKSRVCHNATQEQDLLVEPLPVSCKHPNGPLVMDRSEPYISICFVAKRNLTSCFPSIG